MNSDVTASAIGASHAGEFLKRSTVDLVSNSPRSTFPSAHRIKNFAIRMQGEETGRADLGSQLGGGKPPVVRVEGGVVDALGPASARPEKDIQWLSNANRNK